ncbi:MAG: hypothetical protein RIR06_1058 [Bacteroidota bacterium]|jgi:hypothetical protein
MNKNLPLVLLFFVGFAIAASAQPKKKYEALLKGKERSKELVLGLGTAYYLGEVNPYTHFGSDLKVAASLGYRNNFNYRWSMRIAASYGNVEAWDKDSQDPWIQNRNLNFRNRFYEGSVLFELNFLNYQIGSNYTISPYLFTGGAIYNMNPEGQYNGFWHSLQPAGTEGQGLEGNDPVYKLTGFSLPLGAGLKWNIAGLLGASVEWGVRKTWTDYFDDISTVYEDPTVLANSRGQLAANLANQALNQENINNTGMQRGDPGRKDLYFFCMASLHVRIDRKGTTCWK